MAKWICGVFLAIAGFAWLDSVAGPQSPVGVPQQLAALRAMIEEVKSAFAGIESKLDELAAPVSTEVFTGPLERASNLSSNFKCMVVNASGA